jgi:hypothetical protein
MGGVDINGSRGDGLGGCCDELFAFFRIEFFVNASRFEMGKTGRDRKSQHHVHTLNLLAALLDPRRIGDEINMFITVCQGGGA